MTENLSGLAQAAASLGSQFISAARQNDANTLAQFFERGSNAALLFEIFGPKIVQVDLRLDHPLEQGRLTPYDFQVEAEVGLLELGVLEKLPTADQTQAEGRAHLQRVFGSSLLLHLNPNRDGWVVADLLPVNSDGTLTPTQPGDKHILEVHQGKEVLPLQMARLDPVEKTLLSGMQKRNAQFNLEEMVNALRLWRDFKANRGSTMLAMPQSWASGVEYLISLFDFGQADAAQLGLAYMIETETVESCAREIAQNLRANQFDDRYSLHPDPIKHYQSLFKELGVDPKRDEQVAQSQQQKVFDSIEVPPDDTDFFGPK
jgi:hypothetical protein